MCGHLPFDDRLFEVEEWLFRVAERTFRAVVVLFVGDALVPAFDGPDPPCEAAIAAPVPTVKTTAAEAARSVRLGLRMDSFRPLATPEWKRPRIRKR